MVCLVCDRKVSVVIPKLKLALFLISRSHENAMKAFEETSEYNSKQPEKEEEPEYPEEMMSKDRRTRVGTLVYHS